MIHSARIQLMLIFVALAAGCVAQPAADEAPVFTARGNEPGWLLTMEGQQMTLQWNYGDDEATVPQPDGTSTDTGRRYVSAAAGNDLRVEVIDAVCRDTMSGMPYPNRVTVTINGEALRGCGGAPESLLEGQEWVVEDIAGKGIIDRSRLTLDFHGDGRLTGRAGCNTYGAAWKLSGEGMTVTQPRSTLMACSPALDRQEREFLSVLGAVRRFDVTDDGALVIHSVDGETITARHE